MNKLIESMDISLQRIEQEKDLQERWKSNQVDFKKQSLEMCESIDEYLSTKKDSSVQLDNKIIVLHTLISDLINNL